MTSTETSTVRTANGEVRGELRDGIRSFKGIPYGAPTSGPNRFLPPRKPEPWPGARDAFEYGHLAPQRAPGATGGTPGIDDASGAEGEDCLVLNVFTPGADGAHRPVMVWLHGGGWTSGSGGPAYDGSNLARRGDVVVVTINHRLGALAFLHPGVIGIAGCEASANLGLLDIIAALEWVRDNATAFGGDPGNVTIFGESGGGRKVSALLAMPAAKGLFHRAVIESGPELRVNEKENAARVAEAFVSELDAPVTTIEDLQRLPAERIVAAQFGALRKLPASNARGGFRPLVDGATLPAHPFSPTASPVSAEVPVIVGFNRTEATLFLAGDKEVFDLDEAGLETRTGRLLKDRAGAVIAEMRRIYPEASPSELYIHVHTGFLRYPIDSIRVAERRAALGAAPVYHYTFEWESPARWGTLLTPHALEIPFVFDTTAVGTWKTLTRSTPEAAALAAKVSATWAAFARTGDPNSGGLPAWEPFENNRRQTMVINNESQMLNDPRAAERKLWETLYAG
jgi:para-nitrobenzyl esterase